MVVGITVLDINDNDPVLLNLPSNASVSEGAPVHASVARVRARDADSGRNALLTYNITAGNLGGAFYINDTVRKNGSGGFFELDGAAGDVVKRSFSPLCVSISPGWCW